GPGRRHPAAMLEPREADERYQVDRPVRRIEALACGRTTGGVQSFATFMRRPLRIGATFAIISFNPSPTGCLGQVYPVAARRRPPRWRRWTIRYSITFARRTSDSHCCRQGERSTDRGGMGNWLDVDERGSAAACSDCRGIAPSALAFGFVLAFAR